MDGQTEIQERRDVTDEAMTKKRFTHDLLFSKCRSLIHFLGKIKTKLGDKAECSGAGCTESSVTVTGRRKGNKTPKKLTRNATTNKTISFDDETGAPALLS